MKNSKTVKAAALLLSLAVVLVSCGKKPVVAGQQVKLDKNDATLENKLIKEDGSFRKFDCKISGAELSTARNGTPLIRFYYDFTNTTEKPICADNCIWIDCYQDEQKLEIGYSEDILPYTDNSSVYIKPGITIRCMREYRINDEGGPVRLEVYDGKPRYDTEYLMANYALENLPGAPDELELTEATDADIAEQPTYPTEAVMLDGNIKIRPIRAERTKDKFGMDAVRIIISLETGEATEWIPSNEIGVIVYQNGTSLQMTFPAVKTEGDEMFTDYIPENSVTEVSCLFMTESDSPLDTNIVIFGTNRVLCAEVLHIE